MIDLHTILVPTDFSEPGRSALRYGAAFADQFGAALHVLHAIDPPAQYGFSGLDTEALVADLRSRATTLMETLRGDLSDRCFAVHQEIRVGNPFMQIIKYAREYPCDLIVMGTHGHGPIRHLLLGSVTEKVVRMAPCPVLTVRHPEHEFVMP